MNLKNLILKIGVILYVLFVVFLLKSTYLPNYTVNIKSPQTETTLEENFPLVSCRTLINAL